MGTIARMAAVAGIAAAAVMGATAAASAQEAAPSPAAATQAVTEGVQQSGVYNCGMDYDKCVRDRAQYRYLGHQVSDIYYREGQTCPGGGGCADGYYFEWWI